ncbi:MAG TPA: SDR family oxidoreductase [Burkholderiales bacterium]|nr:SDR family oxidoreductase [Burkholderiales bacterium]
MAPVDSEPATRGRLASPLSGHVVLLTGASEGIGRALAIELAPQRLSLVLTARNRERLEELARECEARGSTTLVVPADLTDMAQCQALVDAALGRFGRLDVLINNAGATMWSRLDALADLTALDRLMRINYLGAAHLTALALPSLKRTQGRVVAIASLAGFTGVPERTGYAASKHAMVGFFESLRVELQGTGVTVTIIAPDFVRSEIHKRAIGPDGRALGRSPMQHDRIMGAEQCARLIVPAIEQRKRLLITSTRGKLGRWLKLIAPRLVDRIAAAAIRDRR